MTRHSQIFWIDDTLTSLGFSRYKIVDMVPFFRRMHDELYLG